MITYNQANGNLSKDGQLLGVGYSGHGSGVNNSAMQNVPDIGPIPQGLWAIGSVIAEHPTLGPYVLPLSPQEGTETFGRSGFFIHGDEIGEVGKELASHGCLIFARSVREAIVESGDTELEVV